MCGVARLYRLLIIAVSPSKLSTFICIPVSVLILVKYLKEMPRKHHYHKHNVLTHMQNIKLKSMQRSGTKAIRTQIQPSKPAREITKITNSQNTKRTYGQRVSSYFPKGGHSATQNRNKHNINTRKVKTVISLFGSHKYTLSHQ